MENNKMSDDEIIEQILSTVNEEFNSGWKKPQQWRIYIFFLIKEGMILYNDVVLPRLILNKLIESGKVKHEAIDAYHQCARSIRYRFVGYKYPSEYYRSVSKELRQQVLEEYNHLCAHCGSHDKLTMDHRIPWSYGGETKFENLQVLCRSCNSTKSNN